MSFCSTVGLINSVHPPSSLDDEESIRLVSLFDHEEIGSNTAQGADSNFLPAIIRRLAALPGFGSNTEPDPDAYEQSLSKSFLISADMAHCVNPNYGAMYETDHKPKMNKGTVIKINANARYATNSPGIVLVEETARRAGVPLQLFVVRNDSSCGSTIGPMLSAALGTRTLDLGNPQLSMHSIVSHVFGIFLILFFGPYSDYFGSLDMLREHAPSRLITNLKLYDRRDELTKSIRERPGGSTMFILLSNCSKASSCITLS